MRKNTIVTFEKKPTTIGEQIDILKQRGLIILNEELVTDVLSHVSYYRLGEYWYVMQEDKENHIFKKDSKFEDVIKLYEFDRELRVLIFNVIERIEISLRTKMIYHLSHEFDPYWFLKPELFESNREWINTITKIEDEITRTKDVNIKNHFKKYGIDSFPPSWKTLEQTSFGGLSKLYGNLKNNIKSKNLIAEEFGAVNHTYLPSWLKSITIIRNLCAHHSRLWNKNLPCAPKLLSKPPYHWIKNTPKEHEFKHLYIYLCIMKYLLDRIQQNSNLGKEIEGLLVKYNNVNLNALGIKENWLNEDLWQN